jgi:cephalosporin hydroxylase
MSIDLSTSALTQLQAGHLKYEYRGIPALKCPFDLAIYTKLIWDMKPRTILEFGSFKGGSALWLADQVTAFGLNTLIYSFDINVVEWTDPRIAFCKFDASDPAAFITSEFMATLPRPFLAIEDGSHQYEHVLNVMRFVDRFAQGGDRLIVEDGIVTALGIADSFQGGPLRAIHEFMAGASDRWARDEGLNDFYGPNMTWNPDGYLLRLEDRLPERLPNYAQDGLQTAHNNGFMADPRFQKAYARGVKAAGADYSWHWRVHVGLWAAERAMSVPGDFVEFGTNRGFLASSIMEHLAWNATGRRFMLLDTFSGIDERFVSPVERQIGVLERNQRDIDSGFYALSVDDVRTNFAEWPKAEIIVGPVPLTLEKLTGEAFAFVHIDMNCAPPEIAALRFIWPKLSPGAVVLLDDYAYNGYEAQKLAMDRLAAELGFSILSLPTGQGLIIKAG